MVIKIKLLNLVIPSLVFVPMPSSLVLDRNNKVTNWISTGISTEKIRLFDFSLEPPMSNLANGRVILNFNNSFLVQKKLFFVV